MGVVRPTPTSMSRRSPTCKPEGSASITTSPERRRFIEYAQIINQTPYLLERAPEVVQRFKPATGSLVDTQLRDIVEDVSGVGVGLVDEMLLPWSRVRSVAVGLRLCRVRVAKDALAHSLPDVAEALVPPGVRGLTPRTDGVVVGGVEEPLTRHVEVACVELRGHVNTIWRFIALKTTIDPAHIVLGKAKQLLEPMVDERLAPSTRRAATVGALGYSYSLGECRYRAPGNRIRRP